MVEGVPVHTRRHGGRRRAWAIPGVSQAWMGRKECSMLELLIHKQYPPTAWQRAIGFAVEVSPPVDGRR
jgi:hypothetical protein